MGIRKPKKPDQASYSPDWDYKKLNSDKIRQKLTGSTKKHRSKKGLKNHARNKVWLQFIWRAFVGTLEDVETKVNWVDSVSERNGMDPYEDEL